MSNKRLTDNVTQKSDTFPFMDNQVELGSIPDYSIHQYSTSELFSTIYI